MSKLTRLPDPVEPYIPTPAEACREGAARLDVLRIIFEAHECDQAVPHDLTTMREMLDRVSALLLNAAAGDGEATAQLSRNAQLPPPTPRIVKLKLEKAPGTAGRMVQLKVERKGAR